MYHRVAKYLSFGLISVGLSSCYTLSQGYEQARLLNRREDISQVLNNDEIPDKTKENLRAVQKILHYAAAEGLNTEDAYVTFVQLDRDAVSYTVQAAPADSLQLKTWWFPIVGSVPYLGYFHKSDRDAKALDLEREGFDVARGEVDAYSSLGWFNDPIYSSMLQRSNVSLAHLLFHELTHRTIWFSNDVDFNEQLADFVADVLTKQYMRGNLMQNEISEYEQRNRDRKLFKGWLDNLKRELGSVYLSSVDLEEKLRRKKDILSEYLTTKKPKFERFDFVGQKPWNNASIGASSLYEPDERFSKAYKTLGEKRTILQFIQKLKKAQASAKDGFDALERLKNVD